MRRDWSPFEDQQILEHYAAKGAQVVSDFLGRPAWSVHKRAQKIGATYLKNTRWTPEETERLKAVWETEGTRCARRFPGRTASAIEQRAKVLGLRTEVDRRRRRNEDPDAPRQKRSCFGYIPGGPVVSVFHLGSKA